MTDVGYKFFPMGRYNSWKRAMTVQTTQLSPRSLLKSPSSTAENNVNAENDSNNASANLAPLNIMFLDQEDVHTEATVFANSGPGSNQPGTSVGSDAEVKAFMQILTLDAAKRLNYDREIKTGK